MGGDGGGGHAKRRGPRSETAHVALLAAARLSAGGITAGTTLLLAHSLTKASFGNFALLTGTVGLLVIITDLGLTQSLARYLAEGRVDRRLLMRVAGLRACLAGLAAGGLLVLGELFGRGSTATGREQFHGLWSMTGLAAAFLLASSTVALADGLFPTLRRVGVWAVLTVLQPAAALVGVVVALRGGHGAASALLALVVAATLTGLIGLVVLQGHQFGPTDPVTMSDLVRYAAPLFGVWVCFAAFGIVDQVVIEIVKGPAAVAPYALSLKLVAMMYIPSLAAASVIAPRLVQEGGRSRDLFEHWLELLAVVYFGLAVIAAALSPEIFRLIGPAYRGDWPIFTALLGYALLLGVAPLISLACNFLGGARGRLPIAALCIGVNLGLDLVLIPSYGAYGAAVSTTVAFLLYVLGHLRLANRILGPAPRRRFNASISRATVAAIVAMVVARVSVQPLSFLGWVGAGLAGLAALVAYLAIMQPVVGPALRWRPVAEPSEFEVRQEP